MSYADTARRAAKFATDNSPAILTAIGVVGTIAATYLAAKASFKAADIIRNEEDTARGLTGDENYTLNTKAKIQLVWPCYVPAIGTAAVAVTAIVVSNKIGTKRAAALAAAYAISEKAFEEYKVKVIEKLGPRKETALRDEIAQERVTAHPPNQVIITVGEVLFMDGYSGRYFMGSVEGVNRAVNQLNHELNTTFSASLTDFYHMIGLPPTKMSDEVGWNADKLLEVEHSTTMSPDGRPCIVMNFRVQPIRRYAHVN